MNAAGLGIIIRDANGNIVAVVDWWCNEYRYPKMWKMEALPCHCVVELASEVGVHEVEFEGNSKLIIKALYNNDPCIMYGCLWSYYRRYKMDSGLPSLVELQSRTTTK